MARESILIVEDEKLIRWSVKSRLEDDAFEVTEAEDGAKAVTLLQDQEFDLVLLDHKLPDTTGIEILERLSREWPETSVVIVPGVNVIELA